jgi:hypothetical protein
LNTIRWLLNVAPWKAMHRVPQAANAAIVVTVAIAAAKTLDQRWRKISSEK